MILGGGDGGRSRQTCLYAEKLVTPLNSRFVKRFIIRRTWKRGRGDVGTGEVKRAVKTREHRAGVASMCVHVHEGEGKWGKLAQPTAKERGCDFAFTLAISLL